MTRAISVIAIAAGAVWVGYWQSSPPAEFEVASIRPAPMPPGANSSDWANQVRMRIDPGRVTFVHPTLGMVIGYAYGLQGYQLFGPEWINSERYDIIATMPPNTPREQALLMLQGLLAKRFKLAAHTETKELPVYALVGPRSESKMRAADHRGPFPLTFGSRGLRLSGQASMAQLAAALSRQVDRPVIDMTGTKGYFEITLDWSQTRRQSITDEPTEGSRGPTVFEAVQEQLGLGLKPQVGRIETLVIERAEKVPTEN